MRVALIIKNEDTYVVSNIIECNTLNDANELKSTFGFDFCTDVSELVAIGNTFDPDTGIIYNQDNARIYPPISPSDQISELEQILNDEGVISTEPYSSDLSYDKKFELKIKEIKLACKKSIYSGYDVDVPDKGILHYSMTEYRQKDLETNFALVSNGASSVYFRDDSKIMIEKYTAEQFIAIYNAINIKMKEDKLRSDGLETLVNNMHLKNQNFDSVTWDFELPEYIQSLIDDAMTDIKTFYTFTIKSLISDNSAVIEIKEATD